MKQERDEGRGGEGETPDGGATREGATTEYAAQAEPGDSPETGYVRGSDESGETAQRGQDVEEPADQ